MKRLGITLFRKIMGIIGCLFFLFSIILPFYHLTYLVSSMAEFQNSTYWWSFRASQEITFFEPHITPWHTDIWFFQPGFYQGSPLFIYVLVVIFVAQLLTMATGIVSVFHGRRTLALAPLALCSLVIVLMTYTKTLLATTESVTMLTFSSQVINSTLLLGYWFNYPAIVMFLFSFILNIIDKKRSRTYTPTPTLTQ